MRVTRARAALLAASRATLPDTLHLIAAHVPDVDWLAIVGACSRECRDAVKRVVADIAPMLLPDLVRNAATNKCNSAITGERGSLASSISWLHRTAEGVNPDTVMALLRIPCVPAALIKPLLLCGLRFTYEQLVTAAKERILGVEAWLEALSASNVQHDIPHAVVQLCAHDYFTVKATIIQDINPANIAEWLHLTTNRSSYTSDYGFSRFPAEERILDYLLNPPSNIKSITALQQQITPGLLEQLLLTAIQRGHHRVIRKLVQFPAIHNISADAVRDCFIATLHTSGLIEHVFPALSVPQVTQHLDGSRAAAVLAAAVQTSNLPVVHGFTVWDVAEQIGVEDLESIIQELLLGEESTLSSLILGSLTSPPAAQQLSSQQVFNIITTVIYRYNRYDRDLQRALEGFLQLEPALQLPTVAVITLMHTAVAVRSCQAVVMLLKLQAAQEFGNQRIVGLLRELITISTNTGQQPPSAIGTQCIKALLELPAAVQISAAAAEDLVRFCLNLGYAVDLVPTLWGKLLASDADVLVRLLTFYLNQEDRSPTASALLQLPAAQQITQQQLLPLLAAAVHRAAGDENYWPLEQLCVLPASLDITAEQVVQSVRVAIHEQCTASCMVLLGLPAAESLPAAAVADLLKAAVQRSMDEVVNDLITGQNLCQLDIDTVFNLLKLGIEMKLGVLALSGLSGLFCARMKYNSSNSSSSVQMYQTILDLAMQHGCLHGISKLLLEPAVAAAALDSSRVQQLLSHAIQQRVSAVVEAVCALPAAAAAVPAAAINEMLQAAVQQRLVCSIRPLCTLPAVGQISPVTAVSLLRQAQTCEYTAVLKALLQWLPAAQQLNGLCVYEVLIANLRLSCSGHLEHLMVLPGVQHLTADQVYWLLHDALLYRQFDAFICLCSNVPAVQSIVQQPRCCCECAHRQRCFVRQKTYLAPPCMLKRIHWKWQLKFYLLCRVYNT